MSVGSQLSPGQTGAIKASIQNNSINGIEGVGIPAGITNSNNTGSFIIKDNTVGNPTGAGVRPGIRVESGSANGNATVCLDISGIREEALVDTAASGCVGKRRHERLRNRDGRPWPENRVLLLSGTTLFSSCPAIVVN